MDEIPTNRPLPGLPLPDLDLGDLGGLANPAAGVEFTEHAPQRTAVPLGGSFSVRVGGVRDPVAIAPALADILQVDLATAQRIAVNAPGVLVAGVTRIAARRIAVQVQALGLQAVEEEEGTAPQSSSPRQRHPSPAGSGPSAGARMHLYESTTGGDTTHARADRGLRWLLFSFKGRARRLDYWKGIGISWGLMIGILLVGDALDLRRFAGMAFVPMVPVFLWMMLAVWVKRWHDRNKSGWWVLITLVPYIGGLWELVECGFLGSGSGLNDFGHNPRGDNRS